MYVFIYMYIFIDIHININIYVCTYNPNRQPETLQGYYLTYKKTHPLRTLP